MNIYNYIILIYNNECGYEIHSKWKGLRYNRRELLETLFFSIKLSNSPDNLGMCQMNGW